MLAWPLAVFQTVRMPVSINEHVDRLVVLCQSNAEQTRRELLTMIHEASETVIALRDTVQPPLCVLREPLQRFAMLQSATRGTSSLTFHFDERGGGRSKLQSTLCVTDLTLPWA